MRVSPTCGKAMKHSAAATLTLRSRSHTRTSKIAHPDIEFVSPNGLTKLRGADKLRAGMEPDAFESASYEPLE